MCYFSIKSSNLSYVSNFRARHDFNQSSLGRWWDHLVKVDGYHLKYRDFNRPAVKIFTQCHMVLLLVVDYSQKATRDIKANLLKLSWQQKEKRRPPSTSSPIHFLPKAHKSHRFFLGWKASKIHLLMYLKCWVNKVVFQTKDSFLLCCIIRLTQMHHK